MLADKFEDYDTEIKQAKFYLLKNIEAPAIVFELGYLSNEIDRRYLTNEKSREAIAASVLQFIKEIE
jgi:N-acetylmuramoyl-L-alanine amidase